MDFCKHHKVPYNETVFPNYLGHFGQPDAIQAIEVFDPLVDVKCSDLVPLFLCSLFAPKCGPTGQSVLPCASLCNEVMRACKFFFDVFGLELPSYIQCSTFADSDDEDVCLGYRETRQAVVDPRIPSCSGFMCDNKRRCIPEDFRCDGHVDCQDQTDEAECSKCSPNSIYCGNGSCMNSTVMCDGVYDCPWGQDERNCIRLSTRNGDIGKGIVEVYRPLEKQWVAACAEGSKVSDSANVCSLLGYRSVTFSGISGSPKTRSGNGIEDKTMTMLKSFRNCIKPTPNTYPTLQLTCTNYGRGKTNI